MTAFTYKGYGRIYTNSENISDVENIIQQLDEFEWSYYPEGLVTSWDMYPSVVYVGKFELDEENFKQLCLEKNIPVFIFDSCVDYAPVGYSKILTKDEIKILSYNQLTK